MTTASFLTVNDEAISLAQALQHLQSAGKLSQFIQDILRQHIITQELQAREDLGITSATIEQAVIEFRLQNQLTDAQKFQQWLAGNGSNYDLFHQQVTLNLKLSKLKVLIAEPKLAEYFIERKIVLDRIILSRILVEKQELAEELRSQIEEGASFEQLAKEYSIAEDRVFNGMMGLISRGSLPDELRGLIDAANPGGLVGPLALDERWGLFRVEQFLPASLEDAQLRQALQNELFERWLTEKIQKLTVKLQVN